MRILVCIGIALAAVVAVEGVAAQGPADPAEPATTNVEVRVWQRVSNARSIYISARPEGGSWDTLGTIPLPLDDGFSSSGNFRYGDIALSGVEVRVWQRVSNARSIHISARAEGGSWDTLGTIPLPLDDGFSSSGNFRYGDITVEVPLPGTPRAETCAFSEHVDRVLAATFQVQTSDGSGSAFYIGNGEWITNHHVVETASSATLVHGQTELSAEVVGALPSYDLAMLRARTSSSVPALEFVRSRPAVRSDVTVVGFPYGVWGTPSVTGGIVSKHGPLSQFAGFASDGVFVQVDADSNPGNSGGPIVDDCGAVVGVVFGGIEETPSGRNVTGVEFGIASETVTAQIDSLRSAGHQPDDAAEGDSSLTVSAFCTYLSTEDVDAEECDRRASQLAVVYDRWRIWAIGVVDFDDVLYRFNGGESLLQADVGQVLRALGTGCHELEIAESGISTHWSIPYQFCFGDSPTPTSSVPSTPSGLSVAKVDIPLDFDDVMVSWNPVAGATWYEVYHSTPGTQFDFEATVTSPYYLDEWPNVLDPDSYIVRACNNVGCSEFSAVVTQY